MDLSTDVVEQLGKRTTPIQRYVIRGEVARGGMGRVLRVWDEDLRRHLAMKVILSSEEQERTGGRDANWSSRSLGRFLEEAQVTGQLDHPGIVPVHELGLDQHGQVYFTMKLVRGETLRSILLRVAGGDASWTLTRVLTVLQKICDAMAYAHEKGVIHRDLKPANVMVGRFGEVYVMDWGLARVLGQNDPKDVRVREPSERTITNVETYRRRAGADDSEAPVVTMDGDVVGTPAYMSPEQARGDIEAVDQPTDIFAVGAILYHLLAGHMPYAPSGTRIDNYAIWARVQEGPPASVRVEAPDAPDELVAICEKAMAREVDARYATMLELGDDVRAFLEGRVVRAFETGAIAEFKKWMRRNRPLAVTVLVAIAVAFTVVTAAALRLSAKNVALAAANERAEANLTLAEEKALEAERRGRELVVAQDRFLHVAGLADRARLADQVEEAAALWPLGPATVPALEVWLARAAEFRSGLAAHRANLVELRGRAETAPALDGSGETVRIRFERPEDRWQHDHLVSLVAELERFLDPGSGLVADVERRLVASESIEERSVSSDEARWLWSAALESIADPAECPVYRGAAFPPQLGLLPMGRDPRSGLWEFAHLLSGEVPGRDPATGELHPTEETGIVLVLLPGGTARIGSQAADRDARSWYATPNRNEQPVFEVELDPFFLSKYEMTQGQWQHVTGSNPSHYRPDNPLGESLLNPVESIDWVESTRVLWNIGLELPTEVQWEYGARAGTDTPWWTGSGETSLAGAANIADVTFRDASVRPDWETEGWLEDHFTVHAPVGRFLPNAFGLHDVIGNAWEWCRDLYVPYGEVPARHGDGLFVHDDSNSYPSRGGGWSSTAVLARSACRYNTPPKAISNDLGLRPARAIER